MSHHIGTVPGQNVKESPTPPWKLWDVIHQERQAVLDLAVVEVPYSE